MDSIMSIISQIEQNLKSFRTDHGISIEYLTGRDISEIKGKHVATLTDDQFKRNWNKLGVAQKINRLMVYQQKLVRDHALDDTQQTGLKTLLYEAVNNGCDKQLVQYDTSLGEVVCIDSLKRDPKGSYYLSIKKSELGRPAVSIRKFSALSIKDLKQATREGRPRPVIVRKK